MLRRIASLILILLAVSGEFSRAGIPCDKRLGGMPEALAFIIMQAVEKEVLRASAVQKFIDSPNWYNLILKASEHVLKAQYAEVFADLEKDLDENGRTQVKLKLAEMTGLRAQTQKIEQAAHEKTVHVLQPRELPAFPSDIYSVQSTFEERRLEGRPVFVSTVIERATQNHFAVVFDPHNDDPAKRLLKFAMSLEGDPIPRELGLEEVAPRGPYARKRNNRTAAFYGANGKLISKFTLPWLGTAITSIQIAEPPGGGSPVAAVHYRTKTKVAVFLVNVESGKRINRFDWPVLDMHSVSISNLIFKGGTPYVVFSTGLAAPAGIQWINGVTGETGYIPIASSVRVYDLGTFRLRGVDYLIWRGESGLTILDFDSGSFIETPQPNAAMAQTKVTVYEYQKNLYAFLSWEFVLHFQLTAPSRP